MLSDEHRAAISAALKGRAFSEEHRAAISRSRMGITASKETRARLSAARKGRPKSPEHRAAISAALRGRLKKPDTVDYYLVHLRLGRASEHLCPCGAPALDWAYQYTAAVVLYSPEGWPYSTDPADYLPMCRRCHKKLDRGQRL